MKLKPISKAGTTPSRKRFWDAVFNAVVASQKAGGRNVTVDQHPGKGTLINIAESASRRPAGPGGPGPSAGIGACCVPSPLCDVPNCQDNYTVEECEAVFGHYQGDGTICDPNPCVSTLCGACCHGGICTIETHSACASMGGTFLGEDTTCGEVDCAEGACCKFGSCTTTTRNGCLTISGVYLGDGTACVPNPCEMSSCGCSPFGAFDGSLRYFRTLTVSTSGTQIVSGVSGETVTVWNAVAIHECHGGCSCTGSGTEDITSDTHPPHHCDLTASGCFPDCPDGLCRWPDGTSGCGWVGSGDPGCEGPFGTSNMSACCTSVLPICCASESIFSATWKIATWNCPDEPPCYVVNCTSEYTLSDECIL